MRGRHITTGITLLVLVVIVVAAAAYGVQQALAPVGGDDSEQSTACHPRTLSKGQRIRARQIVVSVFNAGSRSGLADTTLARLSNRGFRAGSSGNAPEGTSVRVVQVWTTQQDDLAARLVARQFGAKTPVRVVSTDLGPGIDVVVGNGLQRLVKASTVLAVTKSASACLGGATAS